MTEAATLRDRVRPLLRVRQIREFTPDPVGQAELDAIVDAGRWTGSSRNEQPWRFVTITNRETLKRLHDLGLPQTRSLATAPAAIAVVIPDERPMEVMRAFDEGRAAERLLIAAYLVGLAGGVAWIRNDVRAEAQALLGIPDDRILRTLVVVGHPTEAGLQPKAAPGQGRLPREEVVFSERWRG
jgi:nitroreductase